MIFIYIYFDNKNIQFNLDALNFETFFLPVSKSSLDLFSLIGFNLSTISPLNAY